MRDTNSTATMGGSLVIHGNHATLFGPITVGQAGTAAAPAPPVPARISEAGRAHGGSPDRPGLSWNAAVSGLTPARR